MHIFSLPLFYIMKADAGGGRGGGTWAEGRICYWRRGTKAEVEKWDYGSTGVTKCGLFYSWKVVEAEKKIDRSMRARRKLLHIYLPVFTSAWLPALFAWASASAIAGLGCLPTCLPACLSTVIIAAIRARILLVDHLLPFNKVSGRSINIADRYARHVRANSYSESATRVFF